MIAWHQDKLPCCMTAIGVSDVALSLQPPVQVFIHWRTLLRTGQRTIEGSIFDEPTTYYSLHLSSISQTTPLHQLQACLANNHPRTSHLISCLSHLEENNARGVSVRHVVGRFEKVKRRTISILSLLYTAFTITSWI